MRANLPVSATEYFLQDGESIVSTTELLGSLHNMVHRLDMRRKNGDFCWVLANVTLVKENGQPTASPARRRSMRRPRSIGALGTARPRGWPCGKALLAVALTLARWHGLRSAIVEPITQANEVLRCLAGGDLSVPCESSRSDDTGQLLRALHQLKTSLNALPGDVRTNVHSLEMATQAIAAGSMDRSRRTESQAASLEQTAASMDGFSTAARPNENSTGPADRLAVKTVGAAMGEISGSASHIAGIIGLIDGIALQTDILGPNAAFEAVRTGEQGRSFAVVAGEDIKHLIGESVEKSLMRSSITASLLANVLESAMEAIITVDTPQKIIGSNQTAEKMFGGPRQAVVPQPGENLIPVRFRHRHARQFDQFATTGTTSRRMGSLSTVADGLKAAGEEFSIEVSISDEISRHAHAPLRVQAST